MIEYAGDPIMYDKPLLDNKYIYIYLYLLTREATTRFSYIFIMYLMLHIIWFTGF